MVTLADRWLADVGFGDSFLEPLLLDKRGEQVQGTHSFRMLDDDDHLILMRDSEPQYRFALQPYGFADYEEMCRFHQTSPESHFTKNLICSRVTSEGRITLSGMKLITTSGPERQEQTLNDQKEYDRILRDQFGIVMATN
jgi:N-hydroxyarylamine O-acetyltransferase